MNSVFKPEKNSPDIEIDFSSLTLIIFDDNLENKVETEDTIRKYTRNLVLELEILDDMNYVVDILTDKRTCCVAIIVRSSLADLSVSTFEYFKQVHSIYIWSENGEELIYNSDQSTKVKCITPDLNVICEAILMFHKKVAQNAAIPTFVSLKTEDDASQSEAVNDQFFYCQLFHRMLLDAKLDPDGHQRLRSYLQTLCGIDGFNMKFIDTFEKTYTPTSAIWWYTRESFIYQRLNKALRELDMTGIYYMLFFIQDLSQQIVYQHKLQKKLLKTSKVTLYRGLTVSNREYCQLKRYKGQIITNNTFLSTTKSLEVAKVFASGTRDDNDRVGIILEFEFDSNEIDVPFADISTISFYPNEQECIFTIGTYFRVVQIMDIDRESMIACVKMKTTLADTILINEKLEKLMSTMNNKSHLMCIIDILFLIGQPKKAFEFNNLLQRQKSVGNYLQQDCSLENLRTDELFDDLSTENDLFQILYERLQNSTTNYENIADIQEQIAAILLESNKLQLAEQYYRAAQMSRENSNISDDHALFNCYDKLGGVYYSLGQYSKAIQYYEKAMDGRKSKLGKFHLEVAKSYNHIGGVFHALGKYDNAKVYYKEAIDIGRELNAERLDLIVYYNNIGSVYDTERDYGNALAYYNRALKMFESTDIENYQIFTAVHNNLGIAYKNIGEYAKALLHHQKALELRRKYLPNNKLDWAASMNNLGLVNLLMGGYDLALQYFQETLEIQKSILPESHPHLALSYSNIGIAHLRLGNYDLALENFLKCATIRETSYDMNQMDLMKTYRFIAETYCALKDQDKADVYLAKVDSIEEERLSQLDE